MSTIQQLRESLNEARDTLTDGWQRLYERWQCDCHQCGQDRE